MPAPTTDPAQINAAMERPQDQISSPPPRQNPSAAADSKEIAGKIGGNGCGEGRKGRNLVTEGRTPSGLVRAPASSCSSSISPRAVGAANICRQSRRGGARGRVGRLPRSATLGPALPASESSHSLRRPGRAAASFNKKQKIKHRIVMLENVIHMQQRCWEKFILLGRFGAHPGRHRRSLVNGEGGRAAPGR